MKIHLTQPADITAKKGTAVKHNTIATTAGLAEPFLDALARLAEVADWADGIDLANITDEDRQAVFAADRAVRDAAQVVTLKARFGLKAEQRHLADAITPLFVALAGMMPVLDELMFDDHAAATALHYATN